MKNQTKQKIYLFEKLYKKMLNSDEQEEIKHNLYGFLNLLIEIDREQKERKDD